MRGTCFDLLPAAPATRPLTRNESAKIGPTFAYFSQLVNPSQVPSSMEPWKMFNRVKSTCAALAAMFALHVGNAQAVPFAWLDDFNPGSDIRVGPQLDFTHDIRDGATGFRAGLDTITSATLNIFLGDDALFGDLPILGDGQESVSFNFDGTGWTSPQNVSLLDIFQFQFDTLLMDGVLGVSIRATRGDFEFRRSTLVVRGDRAAVPEPVSLALFGAGMLGLLAFAGRKGRAATKL